MHDITPPLPYPKPPQPPLYKSISQALDSQTYKKDKLVKVNVFNYYPLMTIHTVILEDCLSRLWQERVPKSLYT